MRRSPLVVGMSALVIAFALVGAGCGGGEETTASPETVTGTVPTEPTETDTTETETTETETDETETETNETETETTETETTETEAPAQGDAAAGKQVFLGSAACGSCHTFSDAGTSGTIGPNLDDSQPSFETARDRVANGRGAMPAFAGTLSDQQITDVATYVSQAAGG